MSEVNNDKDLIFLRNALFRNSLSAFIEKTFAIVSPGDTYLHNWHIDLIAKYLEDCANGKIKRLIINVPPRYMKSICTSVGFVAWFLGNTPSKRIIVASYADELSKKHSLDCKATIESRFYHEIFPSLQLSKSKNTQTEFITTRGGGRLAVSVGGTLTGRGADMIIIDDPLKPMESVSDTTRQHVNQWFNNTLYSRLNDKKEGCIIIVMQRLHEDDLVGHVLKQEEWTELVLPAIAEEYQEITVDPKFIKPYKIIRNPGDALHFARENIEKLEHIKNNIIGSYNFASQYQQRPAPLGGGLIKLNWFSRYSELPQKNPYRIVQSWDTASKIGELNDYSVCTTWYEYNNAYYIVDILRLKLEFPELKKMINFQAERYKPNAIIIEDKGSGIQLIQDLKQETKLSIIPFMPDGDKATRMIGQTPKIESGRVFIPEKSSWLQDFEHEMAQFPNGKHDDQIDSMSQALQWLGTLQIAPRIF